MKKLSIMTFIFDPFYVNVRFHFGVKVSLSVLKPQACKFIKKRLQNRSLLRSTKERIEITGNIGTEWVNEDKQTYGSKYTRMDQVKFVGDSL